MEIIRANNLTGKMLQRLIQGIAAGVFILFVLYFGGTGYLRQYFFETGYIYNQERGRAQELQEYIRQKKLKATDAEVLRKWSKDKNLDEFTVSRGDLLLFDAAYEEEMLPGSRKVPDLNWRIYHKLVFADGEADVHIYEGFADKYFDLLLGGSVLAGFLCCLGIFAAGMQEDVKYIQCLRKEVRSIGMGDFGGRVTIQGRDELTELAEGLQQMRDMLAEKEKNEQDMRLAQEKLVLGMSHDLRTPLTGLISYIEILKKQHRENRLEKEYIDKAFDKAMEIRGLSEQMFEYFFVNSAREMELEMPEEVSSAFGDHLSELCALLEYDGFAADISELEWRPALVRIQTELFGRIMNNIISNLQKYADRGEAVQVKLLYEKDRIGLFIQNKIADSGRQVQRTGIGMQNISAMMKAMNGTVSVETDEDRYRMVLYFPEVKQCL